MSWGRALAELRNGVTLEEAERRIWEWWQRGWVMASDIEGQTTRMIRVEVKDGKVA